jgi:hypothetical protein
MVAWGRTETRFFGGVQLVIMSDFHTEYARSLHVQPRWPYFPRMVAPDAERVIVVVLGDMGEISQLKALLLHLCENADEVWFVPGNHDGPFDAVVDTVLERPGLMGQVFEYGEEDEYAKEHTSDLMRDIAEEYRVDHPNFRLLVECGIKLNGLIFYGHALSFSEYGRTARDLMTTQSAMSVGIGEYQRALDCIPVDCFLLTHKPPRMGMWNRRINGTYSEPVCDIDSGNVWREGGKRKWDERTSHHYSAIEPRGIDQLSEFIDKERPRLRGIAFGHVHRMGGCVSTYHQRHMCYMGRHDRRRIPLAINASVFRCERHPDFMSQDAPLTCEDRVREARATFASAVTLQFPHEDEPARVVVRRWHSSVFARGSPGVSEGRTQLVDRPIEIFLDPSAREATRHMEKISTPVDAPEISTIVA